MFKSFDSYYEAKKYASILKKDGYKIKIISESMRGYLVNTIITKYIVLYSKTAKGLKSYGR